MLKIQNFILQFLTFIVWPWFNSKIGSIAKWKNAQPQDIKHLASLDWDVRCSSILNSILVFGLTSAALMYDIDWADVNSQSELSKMAMQMCGGYFITDFIVVIICRNYYPGVTDFVIHHIVAISAFVLVHHHSGKFFVFTVCYKQFIQRVCSGFLKISVVNNFKHQKRNRHFQQKSQKIYYKPYLSCIENFELFSKIFRKELESGKIVNRQITFPFCIKQLFLTEKVKNRNVK